jgi:hypothetical protein
MYFALVLMKTLIILLPLIVLVVGMVALYVPPCFAPDFAIQSEAWDFVDDTWDVRVCSIVVYFAGPLAIEDRSDCGLPWAVVTR